MRCPSCNKFPALSTDNEPEVNIEAADVEIADDDTSGGKKGTTSISGDVRIVLTSECCGDEIKESTFDVDLSVDVEKAKDCKCKDWTKDLEVEVLTSQIEDRNETHKTRISKRGINKGETVKVPIPYRYQKHFYGASVTVEVKCACEKGIGKADFYDEVQASGMDELN